MTAPKAPKAKTPVKKPVKKPATAGTLEKKPAAGSPSLKETNVDVLFDQISAKLEAFESSENGGEAAPFDFAEVLRLLDLVLAIDPDNRAALNHKGMMLVGMGENAQAVVCFDRLLKVNPADKEVLNNKGIALYGLGKDKEALKYVDKAIELDRRYGDALINKAVILHGLGQDKEAETLLARARALYNLNG